MILKTIRGDVISKGVIDIISSPEIIKVRNQLLDGTYHIQTIGQPHSKIEIKLEVDKYGKNILEQAYILDTELDIINNNNESTVGLLESKPTVTTIAILNNVEIYEVELVIISNKVGW